MSTTNPSSSVSTVLSVMPLICYVPLVAAACYSYFSFGHWPSYGNPDPSNLPVRAVYLGAIIASLLGLLSVFLWPGFIAIRAAWTKQWGFRPSSRAFFYAIGATLWIVGIARSVAGNGGIVNWIAD